MATAATTLTRPLDLSTSASSCFHCGVALPPPPLDRLPRDAQRRIAELESEVRLLTEKATTAVYRLADSEDEVRKLKSSLGPRGSIAGLQTSSDTNLLASTGGPLDTSASPEATAVEKPPPATTRLSSYFSRKPSPATPATAAPAVPSPPARPPSVRENELQEALDRELAARQQAETKITQMSGELEELSAQLFQQANEMVATERRARARLEERVEVLEKRDGEKRARLERLEGAMKRIERVHGLLKGT